MSSKEIQIPEIGKVTLRKNSRAKHVSISIKPYKGVFLTLPRWVSYLEGERILNTRIDWIKKHLPKIQNFEEANRVNYENGDLVSKYHRIFFNDHNVDDVLVRIKEKRITISIPAELNQENERVQSAIKFAIEHALRKEAKEFLPIRINKLADEFGFSFNKLVVKNIKSRWGSCSYKNNINLSIFLMKLPEELIDYVILHELMHTKIKNHSPLFWNELIKIIPSAKALDRELKKYGKFVY